jgi:arsenate reductase
MLAELRPPALAGGGARRAESGSDHWHKTESGEHIMTGRTSAASTASVKPVTIYHNPRCTKSRQTLALLEQRGIQPRIIEYLVTPPTEAELKRLLKLLGISPRELLRTKEEEYKQTKLDKPDVSDAEIIRAMIKYPRLMERPIVVADNKAALGRPPENVLKII